MNKVYRLIGNRKGYRFYCVVDTSAEFEYGSTEQGGEFNVNFQSVDKANELMSRLSVQWPDIKYSIHEVENPDEYEKSLLEI